MISPVPLIKVTRNGRILWKHGPLLFSTLMVRTVILEPILLYHASKYKKTRKDRAIKTVSELPFFKKCCNSSKKHISIISNTEWRSKLVDN